MSESKEHITVVSMMSGTSLDGLDICIVTFSKNDFFDYHIGPCTTVSYDEFWKKSLSRAQYYSEKEIILLDEKYANWLADQAISWIQQNKLDIDLICSHGHTILHQPEKKITFQLGNHINLAKKSGLRVVCDFRKRDVEMGGQGAPLVPMGDQLLFSDYTFCLNLGGFSNISYETDGKRLAFDISPCNLILNQLSNRLGYDYDDQGEMARSGKLIPSLLNILDQLEYYSENPPKSLGREWLESCFLPLFEDFSDESIHDLLHTVTEHIAFQIGRILSKNGRCLTTGGGAYNSYLIERINHFSMSEIIIPSKKLIEYKEALIFGLLGVLRLNNKINILASVTGAPYDHSGGVIFEP